jgi:hypothetical protein
VLVEYSGVLAEYSGSIGSKQAGPQHLSTPEHSEVFGVPIEQEEVKCEERFWDDLLDAKHVRGMLL